MNAPSRIRLEYLDGLRGLAALYVMLGHAYIAIRTQVDPFIGGVELKLLKLIDAGHFAVALFIVLSGYVLMMPIARTPNLEMRGGWWAYIKRRGRRIMPPYYAGLALSILILLLVPAISGPRDFTWQSIVSHALLIHNLHPETILTINGPMWSVAMEWQIYFFLPFLLLPVLRRFGPFAMLAAAMAVGLAPFFLLPASFNFAWTYTWYIGLFAMGGLGALINFSNLPALVTLRERLPWGLMSLALLAVTGGMLLFRLSWAWEHLWFADSLLGVTTVVGIVTLTQALVKAHNQPSETKGVSLPLLITRVLELRWMGLLGAFSYSLYLIHEPILKAISTFVVQLPLTGLPLLAVQYALVVPVVTALCYLFYLAFERPFVTKAEPTAKKPAPEATVAAD